jgi:hypothetical protein
VNRQKKRGRRSWWASTGSDNGSKELLLIVMGALEKIEPPFSSILRDLIWISYV